MNTISTQCPQCGVVAAVPVPALLAVAAGDPAVTWVCAGCADLVTLLLSSPSFLLLVTLDVPLLEVDEPGLDGHPEHPSAGVPFTPDDLIDLHAALELPTWFDDLSAGVTPPRP